MQYLLREREKKDISCVISVVFIIEKFLRKYIRQDLWEYGFGFRVEIFFLSRPNMLCDFGAVGCAHHPTSHYFFT